MPDDLERLRTLLREGKCCSVALVQMGLELRGEQNERLLQAMGALCGGIQGGLACGALTGAACLMNVLAPDSASSGLVQELTEWFTTTMGRQYGSTNCEDIVHGDPLLKRTRCPGLVEATYLQAKNILATHGYEFD
jgi:hypothetical protein